MYLTITYHFNHLPKGAILTGLDGELKEKGVDPVPYDNPDCFLDYGFPSRPDSQGAFVGPYRTE